MQATAKHERRSSRATRDGANRSDAAESRALKLTSKLAEHAEKMQDSMSADEVHKLRTTVRRVEVVLQSAVDARGKAKLDEQLKKLRKRAGKVRDLDVHLGMLEELDSGDQRACHELHSYLKDKRDKHANKLEKILKAEVDDGLSKRLKRTAKAVHQESPDTARAEEQLASVRQRFISLTANIPEAAAALHQLRIDCKRLRYEVEALAPEADTRVANTIEAHAAELVEQLKRVQDEIGVWHDWLTLHETAQRQLPGTAALLALLRARTATHYHAARRTVAEIRSQLEGAGARKKPPKAASRAARSHSLAV
ncbi:MAG TPA: CHAD domain-containing protein [Terriglobales bacterium]